MASQVSNATAQPPSSCPANGCQQCGATDKKLKRCSQCLEPYCSRVCQEAAWPKHKEACQLKGKTGSTPFLKATSWKVVDQMQMAILWGTWPGNEQNGPFKSDPSTLSTLQFLTVTPRFDF